MGRELKKPVSAAELAHAIGRELVGADLKVSRVDSADAAGADSLCFAKNGLWSARARSSGAGLVLCETLQEGGTCIVSPTPRLDFAKVLEHIDRTIGFVWSEAPPNVDPTARVGSNVVLGNGVVIGPDTVVAHNVVIGNEVRIGARCKIKSGAIIGEEGFGFERDARAKAIRLPHIGTVLIGDDVEIGSLTTVCRGTLGDTRIRDGAKIDDHVHIAHNIDVGEDAFIIACAEVSGGVKIGQRAWIAPAATVLNQVSIGDDAVVGLGAVVVRSVDAGTTVVGNPAKPLQKNT